MHLELILIIDDLEANRYNLSHYLKAAGYRVIEAANGKEAFELSQKIPDLILLDVKLPDISGHEVCRQLKSSPLTSHIPIIQTSANFTTGEDHLEGIDFGADAFLVTPVDPLVLLATVKAWIRTSKAERKAETHRKTLLNVFMQSSAAIAICRGRDFVFEFANLPYQEVINRQEKEMLERGIEDVIPELEKSIVRSFQSVYDTGQPFVVEELPATIVRENGPTLRYYNLTVNPVIGEEGKVERAVIIGYDVTKQVEARMKVEGLLADLQKVSSARDDFISIASHELNTPITALKLQLQSSEKRVRPESKNFPTPESIHRTINISLGQVERLYKIVADLLDTSRVESGKLTYQFEDVDLAQMTNGLMDRFNEICKASGCRISLIKNAQVSTTGDLYRLEQVVTNLITNAIKYGQGSEIKISVEETADSARISVEDSGLGIRPEKLPHIFEKFERGISHKNISGLGLGLFIAKTIVDAHRGAIEVVSEPGKGSKFTVVLPKFS